MVYISARFCSGDQREASLTAKVPLGLNYRIETTSGACAITLADCWSSSLGQVQCQPVPR